MVFRYVMNMSPHRRDSLTAGLCLLLLSGMAFAATFGASGCSRSEAAPARKASPESTQGVATAKSETENYIAEIKTTGSYKAGAEGTVEVTLTPKGGYHTNAQYPYKFKLNDPAPEGVSYPKPILQRADGSFEEKKGSFKVPFTAAKAGNVTIAGVLSLSVCSDANCIMDKVPLDVAVEVK